MAKNNCIIWQGPRWSQGRYGMDYIHGKSTGAHRAAWIRAKGPIPKDMVVCHSCDNGLCVNINHLFLGTRSDNMRDCRNKGRLVVPPQKGSKNGNAKCNVEARNATIKHDRANGSTYKELRVKYQIKSNGHLRNILVS